MEETDKKIAEFWRLRNKLQRYWKRLTREALTVAKEKGLELVVSKDPLSIIEGNIKVFNYPDGLQDNNLLILARPSFPSLYSRFYRFLEKHDRLKQEFAELYS